MAGLKPQERLKGKKNITRLYSSGKTILIPDMRLVWMPADNLPVRLKIGFAVSRKHFRNATQRNRIRRLMKEACRIHKHTLINAFEEKGVSVICMLIFTGKDMPDYPTIQHKIVLLLQRLEKCYA